MSWMSKCLVSVLFLAALTWGVNSAEAGVLLESCKVKSIEIYRDAIHIELSIKKVGKEKDVRFQLESPHNPYARAQLSLLRDGLIFRKEIDVLVEEVEKKPLILAVMLAHRTHD